ncbi:unnamed protein product [Rotaria sp. Silwood1]|nr:unnamed protein product [Rotaria sp. Silwood1]
MNLAGADGVLADEERKWILGNAAAKGAGAQVVNYFTTYQPTKADLEAMMTEKPRFTREACRSLIFEAILAASADNYLHPSERDAIYQMSRVFGIDDALMRQLEQAALNEISHRHQVLALMYPEGLQKSIDVSEPDFKSKQT